MIKEFAFRPDEIGNAEDVREFLAGKARIPKSKLIITKSFIDARRKPDVKICYRVTDEVQPDPEVPVLVHKGKKFSLKTTVQASLFACLFP